MIEVVVIDRDKPDETTDMFIGDHIFLMTAKKIEDSYEVDSVVIGNMNANALIENLACAVTIQLKDLSRQINVPYSMTLEKFIRAMFKAYKVKEPKGD